MSDVEWFLSQMIPFLQEIFNLCWIYILVTITKKERNKKVNIYLKEGFFATIHGEWNKHEKNFTTIQVWFGCTV